MASFKGKAAPSIPKLQDQNGKDFDLTSYYGKEALCVFFYPQAMTMGCTKEACALRDVANEPSFTRSDSTPAFRIVGISSDPVDKLKQFEQKYDLPYTLLSDWNQDARKAFGVNGTRLFGIAADRVTIIIDKEGKVVATEDSAINMGKHSALLKHWHAKIKN